MIESRTCAPEGHPSLKNFTTMPYIHCDEHSCKFPELKYNSYLESTSCVLKRLIQTSAFRGQDPMYAVPVLYSFDSLQSCFGLRAFLVGNFTQSVTEKSDWPIEVLQTLPCRQKTTLQYHNLLQFFGASKFPELKVTKKGACLKSSKDIKAQVIDFQPFLVFETTRSMLYFRLGIGNLVKNFQSRFTVPRYR